MKKFLLALFFLLITVVFFYPTFLKGLLPIPSDTIVGLYHPYRDFFANQFPNGIPFKNFLLTDPVRQQYVWKELSISLLKSFELPLWNPYNFSGTPLLANFQSSPFYIFNFLFFILPFQYGWIALIILQTFLASLFTYLYLKNLKLSIGASIFGAIAFSFSGFSIAWLEWGTMLQTVLWLPFILFLTDKIFLQKKKIIYLILLIFALCFSSFAGHPQLFLYVFLFFLAYFLARFLKVRKRKFISLFFYVLIPFLIITFVQWFPAVQFSGLSARHVDLNWHELGWFIPWQNLIQLIAPDFFGNPSTLNYWGIWNYGEFVNYIGILPFIFAVFCLFYKKDKKTLFFGTVFFLSLIFSLPTVFAKLPYFLKLPLLSGFQPTRLNSVTDFSLAILAAMGIDHFYKEKKSVFYPVVFTGLILTVLWIVVLNGGIFLRQVLPSDLLVAKNNLYLPTIIFTISILILFIPVFKKKKEVFYGLIIIILIFDLFRFGWKFTPFTPSNYLYPQTKAIKYLLAQKQPFRFMSTDSRIFPPNFSIIYRLQTIGGYDPLYLLRYGELMAATGRQQPNIQPPFGFNRIIEPQNSTSPFVSLLNVKYILSFNELKERNLSKVFSEGEIKIYENTDVCPRIFFAQRTINANSKQEAINLLFDRNYSLKQRAVVESSERNFSRPWSIGKVNILTYRENKVVLETTNEGEGFLVFTDSFYPTWHVKIDNKKDKIYLTDYNFRGVIIPKGKHKVEFYNTFF